MILQVYTRRWGHYDPYQVVITETGWEINHIAYGGPCDPSGSANFVAGNFVRLLDVSLAIMVSSSRFTPRRREWSRT